MNAPIAFDPVGASGPLTRVDSVSESDLAAFLASMPGATPFHTAAWGSAVAAATGHRWHCLGMRDGSGRLVAVLPLHHIRSRLFGSALVSSGFAVDGGILSTCDAATQALAAAAIELARNLGLGSIDVRGGAHPVGWALDDSSYLGFTRPLAASRDDELSAIPRKHRAEVRKALANDLAVSVGQGRADRDAHFLAYATSVRNLGTPVFPRRLFDAVLDAFGDDADIVTIRHNGAVVASVLSLYWQGSVMPYWGGGTAAARGLRANERMYFELMDHARNRGCTRFDFGRSKVGSGPAAYKKNWGFDPAPLSYALWSAEGAIPRDTNPTSAKYRLMVESWQKLPLWLANRLGPIIARQLG
jgi:FemAB-related protein (PEP-CTERM system-associated)